ncbi:hypothetical protein [Streptomyces sp. NPDC050546]|uniref:hypothetical protein n=1 Tax=Streptomyces sp. NPDC050546 TaxID=3365628 RepID=UPI00379EC28B
MRGSAGVGIVVAGLVLAVGGCAGGTDGKGGADQDGTSGRDTAPATPSQPPSKELVRWVGAMCESTVALRNERARSAADLKELRGMGGGDDLLVQSRSIGHLNAAASAVEGVASDLADLGRSGIPAADRMRDALEKEVKRAAGKLGELSPLDVTDDAHGNAAAVDKEVQSLVPLPDLPALAERDQRFAAAYERAEQCAPGWKPAPDTDAPDTPSPDPTGPLPKAADGKNTAACADGRCEILVTSQTDLTANGVTLHITTGDSVTFQTPNTVMNLGGQGVAQFGEDLKITIVAQNEDGAVLRFSIP